MRRVKRGADGVVGLAQRFAGLTTPALRAFPPFQGGEKSLVHMDSVVLALLRPALVAMLSEDVGTGDITSAAAIPANSRAAARYVSKQPFVVAGIAAIQEMVRLVDPDVSFKA